MNNEQKLPRVYVVKTTDEGEPIPDVFKELKDGQARIGWSYRDDLDLRLIQKKVEQKSPLNEDEKKSQAMLGILY